MNSDSQSATDHTGSSNKKVDGTHANAGLKKKKNPVAQFGFGVTSTNDRGKEQGNQ